MKSLRGLGPLLLLALWALLLAILLSWSEGHAQPSLEAPHDRVGAPDGPGLDETRSAAAGSSADSASIVGSLERALALAVAKVAVNEASLSAARPADVALIWQIAEGHGSTAEARLAWLRAHSSCVLTDRPLRARERRSNCVWSRNLGDDDGQPEGWPDSLAWSAYVERWRLVRRLALRLVRGEAHTPYPCTERPRTWGGPLDHEGALRRGLRRVHCVGTANSGYVRARS